MSVLQVLNVCSVHDIECFWSAICRLLLIEVHQHGLNGFMPYCKGFMQ